MISRRYGMPLLVFLFWMGAVAAEAQELPSQSFDLAFSKGVTALNEGRYEEALQSLLQAEAIQPSGGPRQADLHYDLGLALFRLERYREASPRFLSAAASSAYEAKAHYFAGLSLYRLGLLEESRVVLEKVGSGMEASDVAAPARELIEKMADRPAAKPMSLKVSVGGQYDSNVILVPDEAPFPSGITDRKDLRMVATLQAGYQMMRNARWEVGADYRFYQSLHRDLDRYNIQMHDIGLKMLHDPSSRPYRFDFVFRSSGIWVDQTDYLRSHLAGWGMEVMEGSNQRTRLEYRYRNKGFIETNLFPLQKDRRGFNHSLDLTHEFLFAGKQGEFSLGYTYDRDITVSEDWDYQGHRIHLGLIAPPAWIGGWAQASVTAATTIRPYDNPNSLSGAASPDRRKDTIQIYTATISRTFTPHLSGAVQHLYNINASNLDAYDYDRQISSVYLTVSY